MTVLEQSTQKPTGAKTGHTVTTECLECGEPFEAGPRRPKFCSRPCNGQFNNRRAVRGADFYDLVMIIRFERGLATQFKLWRTLNRLARHYRDQDEAERDGRKSWRPLKAIRDKMPFLWAI